MISFHTVVGVLGGVVAGGGEEVVDHTGKCPGSIGGHLDRFTVGADGGLEEPGGGWGVTPHRDVDIEDLAVLIDRPVDVPPAARNLHVRLVHEPAVTATMTTRPGGVDQEGSEALHPPEQRYVVDLDASLGEEFLHVAVRQAWSSAAVHLGIAVPSPIDRSVYPWA